MSYRKKHVKSKIGRIKPKKSIFKRLWFWIVILLLIIILSGFYTLLFYPRFQLKDILISGNSKVKTQELQDIVLKDSNIELLSFWNIKISSKSIFLIDKNEIKQDILRTFPEVEDITINKKLPQTLILYITERKALGAFCQSASLNGCFLIDPNGVIFEALSTVPDNFTIVRKAEQTGQLIAGQEVMAHNVAEIIYKIKKFLEENLKIDLKEVFVASSLRLNIKTGENWQIYFDLGADSDINLQLTKLNLLLTNGISIDQRKNLRYIDLRPSGRAIVCDNSTCGG